MKNNLQIKICGMREPANIRAIDQLGPDYIGFIFYPFSVRVMNTKPELVPETKAKKVGVFVNEELDTMIQIAEIYNLKSIQLHGKETLETCSALKRLGFEVIKAIPIDGHTQPNEVERYQGVCDLFLFDTKSPLHGGSGKKFNWDKLSELDSLGRFLLSGGIGVEDVDTLKKLSFENLVGIDINSRFELDPGLKNEVLIKNFMDELKI
ncbi:MAG: phosphoribosylanthranilate isomerase [Salinivirgaceae bacterium]|nr:phosphoribosylanthranilate isomerase [Salinivirgaceae bacterium]